MNTSLYRAQVLALILLLSGGAVAYGQTAPNYRLPGDGAAGGAYTPNPRAVSLYNLGLTAYKQNSPESAIIFFKRACDIDPNLADAQYNLGVIYQLQKRNKEAIPRFEEVLRIKPTDPDAHFQLGMILQEAGRSADARTHFSAIAPNNPHFPEAQRRLAQVNSTPEGVATPGGTADGLREAVTPTANPYSASSVYGAVQQPATTPLNQSYAPAQQTAQPQTQTNYNPPAQTSYVPTQNPSTAYGATQTQQVQPPAQVPVQSSPAPSAGTGPVPVVANTSLRVIATGFSAPSGLTFDRNGNLYVANYMSNSIDRIGPDGSRSTFCTGSTIRGPIGLVADEGGNVYVANYNGGTVAKVTPAGISSIIASGFKKPYYLTLDRDGNLYVSQQEDNSIVRISLPRAVGAKPTTP
ncbi:MAG: tetratricopeptide repeat protein [Candidatus Obscuribacterales bacterium]|nr:tetratricopeptide repeat protein [Candidatus Obscuribacterales bacterium]